MRAGAYYWVALVCIRIDALGQSWDPKERIMPDAVASGANLVVDDVVLERSNRQEGFRHFPPSLTLACETDFDRIARPRISR